MRYGVWFALWQAVMAASSTAVAGTTLADVVGMRTAGMMALLIASAQTGTAAWQLAILSTGGGKGDS